MLEVANLFRIYPAETPGDACDCLMPVCEDVRNAAIADAHFARIARKSEKSSGQRTSESLRIKACASLCECGRARIPRREYRSGGFLCWCAEL